MNLKKITLFVMILIVGLTVVSAADVVEDDDVTTTVEATQTEQTTNDLSTNVDLSKKQKTLKTRNSPINISSNVVINQTNKDDYDDRDWTVNQGVTVSSVSGITLNDVGITVAGDYVTLNNLNIVNDYNTKLIDATGRNNITISDSTLTVANFGTSGDNQAIGIDLTNTANVTITGTSLHVNAPSQGQTWKNDTGYWYSVLDVSAILINNAENITIDQNSISIVNTTEKYAYTTMPAITIKNGTKNINVTFNTLFETGAHYVYGIMMNDGVENVIIKNNTITSYGNLYVAGIDASTSNNSIISGNIVNVNSVGQDDYNSTIGEESLAYGIISDTYDTGNQNNRICKNIINAYAIVMYGVEVYKGDNITVCSNWISGSGNKTMGVAFAHTNNSKIINNHIEITGTNGSYHPFYEEVTPVNSGIIFTNQSNYNKVHGNDIMLTAINDTAARSVNITNATGNNVTNNSLKFKVDEDTETGNATAIVDNGNTLSNSTVAIEYPCDCGCMASNNVNTENIETNLINTKTIKQDSDDVIVLNDDNIADYCSVPPNMAQMYMLNANKLNNKNYIINLTNSLYTKTPIYAQNTGKLMAYYGVPRNIQVLPTTNFDNFYGPNATINNGGSVTNSVLSNVQFLSGSVINCTLIDYTGKVLSTVYTYINNYAVTIDGDNVILPFAKISETDKIVNNTPRFSNGIANGIALSNSNYDKFFNEDYTLKEEYANSLLFAIENITKPVIINSNVTLSSLRDIGGYDVVSFIEGADYSLIEDASINKLTLNSVNHVTVNRNKLLSDESNIELIAAVDCLIENNTITSTNTYTVTGDDSSFNNIIRYNDLYAVKYGGDKSVSVDLDENTVESNTPIPTPELTINTKEFTIGNISNISASITYYDEVASNINNGKMVFKVNGKTLKDSNGKVIYAKVINGTATIENYEIPATWNKEGLTISAVYSGSSQCVSLRSQENVTIIKSEPTITTNDITATKEETITLTATVNDGTTIINTGKVVFKINGKAVKDANGKTLYAKVTNNTATVQYTIPSNYKNKNYTITATFMATGYEKLETTKTLTITD